ncbi:Beta-lactamase class C family protein [Erythrobacter sp. NAP1]|uniref:serine hydrolase domain-containing protein n=1 Tax=Erythrobacter sp. NAP1 TaxID=237727 RepID=UPI0000686A20|nr:serine hydrolase [Erythrobacter sp. NAP1]EAQ30564.1 Beta-lactamase class C family protein [Erythrobacter sp. NAP1]
MRKLALVAAGAIVALSSPAIAQSAQERLDARYDRALAAGYKALFLCSAIANAELFGAQRSEQSVTEYELTGIYPTLDPIIRDMPAFFERGGDGVIDYVLVEWTDDAAARIAVHKPDRGCSVQPMAMIPQNEPDAEILTRAAPRMDSFDLALNPDEGLARTGFTDAYGAGARTTGVVILQDGKLVSEAYGPDHGPRTPQRTWSVAKSIAATLVGATVQHGLVEVTDSAGLGENVNDPRRTISIDMALRMASGRYSDTPGNRTDPLYWGGTTVDERAQNWPLLNAPGTVYRYANNDTLAAVQAIEATFEEHPPTELFDKLGMNHTIAETDWQGNYVLSSQVWSTARDLAKLGQLYLNDGVWDGQRILPEGWADYVSSPYGPQPEGTQWGYGAGWWTFRRPEGNAFEGIPDDAFAARGNRGQYVVVVPSRDVVIVRRGEDMVGTRFDIAGFTRDVLAALAEQCIHSDKSSFT